MTKARDLANGATALSAVSATELAYLDGVTSAVQTQIDGKQAANANVSTTELGYLDGVTSAIQTQLDAKIPKTLTTTTGDIIYASSANTPARLGIGSTSQVLTVSGGVPTWATPAGGGITLLSTTTLSGASTTISISATSYTNLLIFIYGVTVNANGSDILLQPNGSSTSTNFNKLHQYAASCDVESGQSTNYRTGSVYQTGGLNAFTYTIYNINSSTYKNFTVQGVYQDDSNRQASENGGGGIKDTNAITSLTIAAAAGSHGAGTVKIYGVK